MRTTADIAREVLRHFRDGGTISDSVVEALFREAHGIGAGIATHSSAVERWARDAVGSIDLTRGRDQPAAQGGEVRAPVSSIPTVPLRTTVREFHAIPQPFGARPI